MRKFPAAWPYGSAPPAGVVIIPPVPAFYNHPKNLDDMINHIVMRVLDQFGLHTDPVNRWDGMMGRK